MYHVKQETRYARKTDEAVEANILIFLKKWKENVPKLFSISLLVFQPYCCCSLERRDILNVTKKIVNIFSLLFSLYSNCIASFIGHLSDK